MGSYVHFQMKKKNQMTEIISLLNYKVWLRLDRDLGSLHPRALLFKWGLKWPLFLVILSLTLIFFD